MKGKPRNPKHLLAGAALVLAVITWVSFSPSVNNQFTNWDDDGEITNNPQVQSLSSANIKATFAALSNTYGFLTPDLWRETRYTKPPAQEFTDLLAKGKH